MLDSNFDSAIAVIGLAVRGPGARDAAELWRNLSGGVESITFFSEEELIAEGHPAETVGDASYVRARGVLDDHDKFDSNFFGIPPSEADLMDPQHRVFLEACYHALEDAGRAGGDIGSTDLYAGSGFNSYLHQVVAPRQHMLTPVDMYRMSLGNEHSYIATRTSYKLNLSGASMHVDTACSSGLVAVHMACQSLLSGQSRMAVAGAVSIPVPQRVGYIYQPDGIQSPDGHCRSFDEHAGGFVEGAGVGVVVLRLLEDALADGDRIRAVIRGSAINNDGSAKIGFTAPSVEAQSAVVRDAMALAEVGPDDIDYVEAHGTATRLGDPVELAALDKAFRARNPKGAPCYIGSVKSNVGHLGAVAGVLGLIKVVLALENEQLPPSLHYTAPNPEMEIERTPFEVNDVLRPWPRSSRPRRAGVTSLGMGGTNAHVVLEEAPAVEREPGASPSYLVPISAKTGDALDDHEREVLDRLAGMAASDLADFGYTMSIGRPAFAERSAVVVRTGHTPRTGTPERVRGASTGPKPSVAFLFPGQGAQYAGMAKELYATEPTFRLHLDACAAALARVDGPDLIAGLYGDVDADLDDTVWTQPVLFSVSYALAKTWMSWGVRPEAMAGNSIGEFVAACLADVLSLDDALRLITVRSRLISELPRGSMLSVHASAEQASALLDPEVDLAVVSSPAHCVLSGPVDAIKRQEKALADAGVRTTRLRTSHAFHSAMMEPILAKFTTEVARCAMNAPAIRYLSNVTGTWATAEDVLDPAYWGRHLRQSVRLADNLAELLAEPGQVLVEVGPGGSLITAARHSADTSGKVFVTSLPAVADEDDDLGHLLRAAGRLWTRGVDLDWSHLYKGERRRRTGVPLYPFERRRHWLDTIAVPQLPAVERPESRQVPRGAGHAAVERAVREILADVAGTDPANVDLSTPMIMQGYDSVLLLQIMHRVKARFGVPVSLSQLLDQVDTPVALIDYVQSRTEQEVPDDSAVPQTLSADGSDSRRLAQLASQLKALQDRVSGVPGQVTDARAAVAGTASRGGRALSQAKPAGNLVWGNRDTTGTLTAHWTVEQQQNLARFIQNYVAKTGGSREFARRYRGVHADPRESARFQLAWKDLIYPIVARRTEGARMWDIDGNEYVDVAMGFGVHLFGHRPPFVMRALTEQMEQGIHVGPQSDLAGEVAELLRALTGIERAAFCNSGTEAVMAAMRMARAVTGRSKIVLFTHSYHGTFDGTLARARGGGAGEGFVGPPGTPRGMVNDILILDYGSDQAVEQIATHAHELAAVLVEPVQGRLPDEQLPEWLRRLREVTEEHGVALIFDEVITGFRLAPGGGQEWAGVQADLVIYGKVLGGGMPIGVIAGRSEYLDVLDGGGWDYGDNSFPMAPQTFFAGTFNKNPLTMAATRAVLQHLIEAGPGLQAELNQRTADLAAELNSFMAAEDLPARVASCASLFSFQFDYRVVTSDLFYCRLISKGVYVWEGRSCFLSTAHGPADVERVINGVKESMLELRAEGLLPTLSSLQTDAAVALATAAATAASVTAPLTEAQQRLWMADQLDESRAAYNDLLTLRLRGTLNEPALRFALQKLVDRHESLRMTFSRQGDVFTVAPHGSVALEWLDAPPGATLEQVAVAHARQASRRLDVATGPLMQVRVSKIEDDDHLLSLVIHHIISDAWSIGVLLRELDALYRMGGDAELPAPARFSQYANDLAAKRISADGAAARQFWAERFPDGVSAPQVPSDFPRTGSAGSAGARRRRLLSRAAWDAMAATGARVGATPFMTALAAYQVVLAGATGDRTVHLGLHAAGQVDAAADLVGYCVNVLPVGGAIDPEQSTSMLLKRVRDDVVLAFEHRTVPFGGLQAGPDGRVLTTVFNVERGGDGVRLGDLDVTVLGVDLPFARWELNLNCLDIGDHVLLEFTYNTDLFRVETIDELLDAYERVVEALGRGLELTTVDLLAAARGNTARSGAGRVVKPISGRRRAVAAPMQQVTLPLLVSAPAPGVDLAQWAGERRDDLRKQVLRHGGVLLRGFEATVETFADVVRALSGEPLDYRERSSPRHVVKGNVYTSTDFPADQHIVLHNEQSYNVTWPLKLFFHCAVAPAAGGQTPIADCRKVYARLSQRTREAFLEHGYLYRRNFRDGLGLSWRDAFQTDDRAAVEQYCAKNDIDFEWNDGDLTTSQVRPAVASHPETGEITWFNHATFFHITSLPAAVQAALRATLADDELPNNTFFGDGRPIPDDMVGELRAAYEAETVMFDWQRGDVLMLDNMLTAHARAPFMPPRKIVVAMSEPWSRRGAR